jgi:hypothetical protein
MSSTEKTIHTYHCICTQLVLASTTILEKRYFHKCGRCELNIAYSLDKSQFEDTKASLGVREDVAFLIPGGLVSTEDMKSGKDMEAMIGKVGVKAT